MRSSGPRHRARRIGLKERRAGQRVYFDTNFFIYAFEATARYQMQLASLASLLDDGKSIVVTSEFTLSELLTMPFRDNLLNAVAECRDMLGDSTVCLAPVTRSVLIRSAMLHGQVGVKTPEALHVVTAAD